MTFRSELTLPKSEETAQEDVRNAIQLLTDYGTGVSEAEIRAAVARLWSAVAKLEQAPLPPFAEAR